jgi:hypothetical protein
MNEINFHNKIVGPVKVPLLKEIPFSSLNVPKCANPQTNSIQLTYPLKVLRKPIWPSE